MIPRASITAWRSRAPWLLDEQVEQDLVLSRAMVEIFSDPLLSAELALRGGTALHKLFLVRVRRYSEDIDLVQLNAGPIGRDQQGQPMKTLILIDVVLSASYRVDMNDVIVVDYMQPPESRLGHRR